MAVGAGDTRGEGRHLSYLKRDTTQLGAGQKRKKKMKTVQGVRSTSLERKEIRQKVARLKARYGALSGRRSKKMERAKTLNQLFLKNGIKEGMRDDQA